jgi:glyceraldehyde 3-phosphate dehydrogenase
MRIAINGYGRIGHCIMRAIFDNNLQQEIQVVAINDLANPELICHLTQFDSTLGAFNADIHLDPNNSNILIINEHKIRLSAHKNIESLNWAELDIDICFECSGHYGTRELASKHLQSGAKKVLVSQPCTDADNTIVFGVNHQSLKAEHKIVSNASCTTNCLAPILKVLDETLGVAYGSMTTIHSYTNDQNLIDKGPGDLYRSRSATQSMIPTRTGAAKAVGLILPQLKGKLNGMAVRVPTINVSLIDLHIQCEKKPSIEVVNEAMLHASENELRDVLAYNNKPLVSIDFKHHPASSIYDANHTTCIEHQLKVMSWYDNEWAFSLRMLDVAKLMYASI